MYCVKCGVELADSEKKCPLCGTPAFHPEIKRPDVAGPFLEEPHILEEVKPAGVLFVLTVLFALPLLITLLCDWRINGSITWSGYVAGALILLYVSVVLPFWFERPNPVIFVPVTFATGGLFLLYINYATGGHWFLSFAFPVTGGAMLIVTVVVALIHYLRRGHLFVFGGALMAAGGFMVLVEFLLNLTFHINETFFWSFYPLVACLLLGGMLLVIAGNKTLRESLEKKIFL